MTTTTDKDITALFQAGAHFAYTRSRRHPTVAPFIFGQKNRNDIFDLEVTAAKLAEAKAALTALAKDGKQILFVCGKNEAYEVVQRAAEKAEQPYVCGRWIGGTLTNFKEISKRVKRLETLRDDKQKGNLDKYTKKERLLIDREIEELEARYGGIVAMKELPAALFVVDPRHESLAVAEANTLNIPVIALANSDCDMSVIAHPIPANDATRQSITYIVDEVVSAIQEGSEQAHKDTARGEEHATTTSERTSDEERA